MADFVITRRIEVHLHHDPVADPEKVEYNRQWEYWRTINNNLYLAANRISSHLFFTDEYEHRLRIQHPRYRDIERTLASVSKVKRMSKEEIAALRVERRTIEQELRAQTAAFLQTSRQNVTYRIASDEFGDLIPSDVLTNLNQNITSTYNEFKKQVVRGERTLSNYKKGIPVPFSMKKGEGLRRRDDGSYYVLFPGGLEWDLAFGRDRSNNRAIVERAFNGDYEVGNSSLQEKNRKVFLLLVVKIPAQELALDPNRIVGVDLGLNIPLYAALNDNEYGGLAIGSREQFMKVRERMSARRRELQRALRHSTQGGRGREHKLQALERFQAKERNWVHTQNHIFSRAVVEYAKQNSAGVIQMESLKSFGRDKEDHIEAGFRYVVRYWSYFELQTLIAEKAKREGIEVRMIDPYHTSQTCSFCGHYEKGQRISQGVFICKNPECAKGKGRQLKDGTYSGINADWNAARNIALSTEVVKK
ncbi:MAG: transposase [Alistipes sp.]|nr:transposase [Alistipes sp.]